MQRLPHPWRVPSGSGEGPGGLAILGVNRGARIGSLNWTSVFKGPALATSAFSQTAR